MYHAVGRGGSTVGGSSSHDFFSAKATAAAASAVAAAPASVGHSFLCCLLRSPCNNSVICNHVQDAAVCRALAEGHLPDVSESAAWLCGEAPQELPTWRTVVYPFVYIPIASLLLLSLLLKVLNRLYRTVAKSERAHKFITNYIGSRDHHFPRNVEIVIFVSWVQIILSVFVMGSFVWRTYTQALPAELRSLEFGCSCVFILNYVYGAFRNEFHSDYVWDKETLVDLFTIPGAIFSYFIIDESGKDWLSLGFLRLVPALACFERLGELGALYTGGSEIVQHITRMAFRFAAFVACFGSFVLVFEVLGDPVGNSSAHIRTGMGEIDFFTVGYWIIETISLVGYGDFTPSTVLSRFVTILTMVSGFVLFTFEVGKIVSMIDKGKRGVGSYAPKNRDHVILVGGGVQNLDETFMTAFLDELYHVSYRSTWPDLVLMTCGADSLNKAKDMFNHNLSREARQRVKFLDGSILNNSDLKRCACGNAKLVWILADTTGTSDPFDEDKENILRALSLSVRYPSTPMMLMLLMPESKNKALSVGIPRQRCFCLNEIKGGLFWQSCICIGFNTMMSNLMVTTEAELHESELLASPWLEHYVAGMGHEVYGLLAVEEFWGKPLTTLVDEAYTRNSICIFAAQINGVVVLAPLRQLQVITERTVVFALAQDELMLHGIARTPSTAWKAVFQENSMRSWQSKTPQAVEAPPETFRRSTMRSTQAQDFFLPPLAGDAPGSSSRRGSRRDSQYSGESEESDANTSLPTSIPGSRLGVHSNTATSLRASGITNGSARSSVHHAVEAKQALYDNRSFSFGLSGRSRSRLSTHTPAPASPDRDSTGGKQWVWGGAKTTSKKERKTAIRSSRRSVRDDVRPTWNFKSLVSFDDSAVKLTSAYPELAIQEEEEAHYESVESEPPVGEEEGVEQHFDESFLDELEERTALISKRATTQPFILVLEFSGEWGPVVSFVTLSRQKYLPFRVPIVVLCPVPPDDELESELMLRRDSTLSFVWGNPHSVRDLLRAGVNDCSIVVGLGQSIGQANSEMAAMLDSDVVMIYRLMENMSKEKTNMIFQFNRTNSMWLLPQEEAGVGHHNQDELVAGRTMLESAYLDPRFASGRVFAPQALGSLLAHCFHVPGMVEVVQSLVVPEVMADSGTASGGESDYETDVNIPWQVRVRPEYVGIQYGDLLVSMIQDPVHPVLPVGIYRVFESKSVPGNSGFVWTNPPKDLILQSSDMIYVLGDMSFGQLSHSADLMPMGPPGLTNLVAFRSARMA